MMIIYKCNLNVINCITNAKLYALIWSVFDLERKNGAEKVEGHVGNFSGMPLSIPHGHTTGYHIRVPNGFNLSTVVHLIVINCYIL